MQYNITLRKKDGSWQYIISYKDSTGKWKQKSKQGFPLNKVGKDACKEAADEALTELKKSLTSQSFRDSSYGDITLGEFIVMHLKHLELYREYNTIKNYRYALEQFADMNNKKIREISNIDVQECIDKFVKRKLKVSTIKFYLQKLSNVMNSAVKQYKIIDNSPVENLKLPEIKEISKKKAQTISEYNKLLNDFKASVYYIIILLAGSCGLRISEILGMTWDSIDFKNAIMTVDKQWKKDKDTGKFGFGTLKSSNSYRKIPLTPKIIKELQSYKAQECTDIYNRIVTNLSGASIVTNLNKTLKKKGYNLTIHELRHTYASNLIANRMDFKTAAAVLGHDVKQTMSTYSHVTDDMFDNAAKIINGIFV